MSNYRKIYEAQYGPIPRDSSGRSYEIHHVDGNNKNNDISNLQLVTIEEHYQIHYQQNDWGACQLISSRMELSPCERSILASLANKKRLDAGTHPFQGENHPSKIRVRDGTHHFIGGAISHGVTQRQLAAGTHRFLKQNRIDTNQILITCTVCGKTGGLPNIKKYHLDNCTVGTDRKISWYNNGTISRQYLTAPDDTWKKGRLVKLTTNRHNTGKKYYNNGIINKLYSEHPGNGWRPGMIPK